MRTIENLYEVFLLVPGITENRAPHERAKEQKSKRAKEQKSKRAKEQKSKRAKEMVMIIIL